MARRILTYKDKIPNFIRLTKYGTILSMFAQSGSSDTYPFKWRAKRNEAVMILLAALSAAKEEIEDEIQKLKRNYLIKIETDNKSLRKKFEDNFGRLKPMTGVSSLDHLLDLAAEALAVLEIIHKAMKDEEYRKQFFEETLFLDAFGGHGIFARAALTIGFPAVYVELNPVPYFFFKTAIQGLPDDVEEYAEALIEYLREECANYYPGNLYITHRARIIKCPHCGGHIPYIATKVGKKTSYYQIYRRNKLYDIIPRPSDSLFRREFSVKEVAKSNYRDSLFCPACGNEIEIDSKNNTWKNLNKEALEDDVILEGGFTPKELPWAYAVPIADSMLDGSTRETDLKKIISATYDLLENRGEYSKYLPYERIPNKTISEAPYGLERIMQQVHYRTQLMSPRQLLCMAKLVRWISTTLEDGLTKDRLVMVTLKAIQQNVLTHTETSRWGVKRLMAGAGYYYNAVPVEVNIPGPSTSGNKHGEGTLQAIFSKIKSYGRVIHGSRYLDYPIILETGFPVIEEPRTPSYEGSKPEVVVLNEAVQELYEHDDLIETIDVAFVDPPYLNMIPYWDLSRLYYVRLNKFYDVPPIKATLEEIYDEDLTSDDVNEFANKLRESFASLSEVMKEDGVIVFQFAPPKSMEFKELIELWSSIMASAIEHDLYPVLSAGILSEKSKSRAGTGTGISRTLFILMLKEKSFEEFLRNSGSDILEYLKDEGLTLDGLKNKIIDLVDSGLLNPIFEGIIKGFSPRPEESVAIGATIAASILARLNKYLSYEEYLDILKEVVPTVSSNVLDLILSKDFNVSSSLELLRSRDMTTVYSMCLAYGPMDLALLAMALPRTYDLVKILEKIKGTKSKRGAICIKEQQKGRSNYLHSPTPLSKLVSQYDKIKDADVLSTVLEIYLKRQYDEHDSLKTIKFKGDIARKIAHMLLVGLKRYRNRLSRELEELKNSEEKNKKKIKEISRELDTVNGVIEILKDLLE